MGHWFFCFKLWTLKYSRMFIFQNIIKLNCEMKQFQVYASPNHLESDYFSFFSLLRLRHIILVVWSTVGVLSLFLVFITCSNWHLICVKINALRNYLSIKILSSIWNGSTILFHYVLIMFKHVQIRLKPFYSFYIKVLLRLFISSWSKHAYQIGNYC